jgi:hypothetical protein
MQILEYLLARFSESSSYAGLAGFLALIGIQLSEGELGLLVQVLAGLCGLAALLLKERGALKSVTLVVALGLGAGSLAACQTVSHGVATVAAACRALEPAAAAVPGALADAGEASKAAATDILAYVASACASDQAIAAVVAADPSGGSDTAVWVAGLGAGLAAALPGIAPLIH